MLAASSPKSGPLSKVLTKLLHGYRQLVPWGVLLSEITSATLVLCCISQETAPESSGEEGEDDVKSARCLCPGRHTSYNPYDNELQSREVELIS